MSLASRCFHLRPQRCRGIALQPTMLRAAARMMTIGNPATISTASSAGFIRPPLEMDVSPPPSGMSAALFLQVGVGTDQHGQDLTKACIRAVKSAISFNSIPSLQSLVPGGNHKILLRLQLAIPFQEGVAPPIDLEEVCKTLPYGTILPVEIMPGGARFESMCSVPSLGDTSDSWVVAIACVTVGY